MAGAARSPRSPEGPGTPSGLLGAALQADPARPLVTAYDHATGERTELSVATFANWVAKTANLLRDELGTAPGDSIAVLLPLHWQAAVWVHAAWAVGAVVALDAAHPVDVAVVDHTCAAPAVPAGEVVSLGLGPMGLARPGHLPAHAGALDYDRTVHSHGDRFAPGPADPAGPALRTGEGTATAAALAGCAHLSPALPPGARLLVTSRLSTVPALVGATLAPPATGVTAVLVRHLDEARLADLVRQEQVAAALLGTPGALPEVAAGTPAVH